METKERIYIRKGFNSQRTGLEHQHGRCSIVLEHQYGRRDVMWKRSILHPRDNFLRYPKGIMWNSGWLCRWNLANLGLYHTMFNTTHDKAPKISVLPNHAETSVRHTSHQFPMNDIPDQNLHHYHTLCESITARKPFPSQGHIPLEFIYGRKSTPMRYHTKCDPQNIFFVFHRWRFEVAVHQIGCG